MDLLDPALPDLQDAVWEWSQAANPRSVLYAFLASWGALLDELAATAGQIADDANMATASDTALRNEYAPLWGVANEQLPADTGQLRDYLQARAAEDGSIGSLIRTLTTLIARDPNLTGTELHFDGGGAGLTFPADGTGLLLFEQTPGIANLTFPADGTGLTFPPALTFPADGSGLTFDLAFPALGGLTFGTGASPFFDITEQFTAHTLTFTVKGWLAFDRGAVKRALDRFRPGDVLPVIYIETNT